MKKRSDRRSHCRRALRAVGGTRARRRRSEAPALFHPDGCGRRRARCPARNSRRGKGAVFLAIDEDGSMTLSQNEMRLTAGGVQAAGRRRRRGRRRGIHRHRRRLVRRDRQEQGPSDRPGRAGRLHLGLFATRPRRAAPSPGRAATCPCGSRPPYGRPGTPHRHGRCRAAPARGARGASRSAG